MQGAGRKPGQEEEMTPPLKRETDVVEPGNGRLTLKDVILYAMVPILILMGGVIWTMNATLASIRQDVAVLRATVRTEESASKEHRELEREITQMKDDLDYVKETLNNHRQLSPYDMMKKRRGREDH